MAGTETELELGNWNSLIVLGYDDVQVSIISNCCCEKPKS